MRAIDETTGTTPDLEPLERASELAAFAAALGRARRGEGGIILVEAAAGLGKSRLLDAAAGMAGEQDFTVLRAAGSPLERDAAFGVALQLFEPFLRGASPAERERLLSGGAHLAAPLLLEHGPVARDRSSASADWPLLHGLYWLSNNLVERDPLALIIDDAHWADALSLRFALYLAQRVTDLPVVALLATRPAEPGAETDLIPELAAHAATAVIQPGPLSEAAVDTLVGAWGFPREPRDPSFTRACAEVTGGNPLLLRELLVALVAEGVRPTAAAVPRVRQVGPEPVGRAVFLTLRRLHPDAAALARAVAVLGDDATLLHAAELAELGHTAATRAAAALEAGEIFRRDGPAFLHPILRAAVYEEMQPSERASEHHLAARIVAPQAPLELIAAHLIAARPAGDPWAVDMLRRAAERAVARGAPATAASYLLRALTESADPDVRPELLVELGRAQAASGDETALDSLTAALQGLGEGRRAAELLLDIGRLHYARGRFAEAAAAFERGSAELDEQSELKLELEAGYAAATLWDPAGGGDAYDRIALLLSHDRDPATRGERVVLANLASREVMRGVDHERAIELARRAWGDGEYLALAGPDDESLPAITGALIPSGAFAEARSIAEAAMDEARRRGSVLAFATASYLRGAAFYHAGLVDEALADMEQALDARRYGWAAMLPAVYWYLARALIARGEVERAVRALIPGPGTDEHASASPLHGAYLLGLGHLALAQGDTDGAVEPLLRAGELHRDVLGTRNAAVLPWPFPAAIALSRAGRVEEAAALADEYLGHARRYGAGWLIGVALRTRGVLAGREGIPLLEQSVETLDGSEARLELAESLIELGSVLRRANKRAVAREPLKQGLDLADRCGATALAEWARDELLASGGRPRRTRLSGPAALTASERRIAIMAGQGMTNRDIAEALFVTVKTVSWHLGNAYSKLGVSSREKLADALASETAAR